MKSVEQHAFLAIARVRKGHEERLESLLEEIMRADPEENPWVPFAQLKSIHFARWAILPLSHDAAGREIPAQLLFATNYDGSLQEHLGELVKVAGPSGLDQIYRHCEGFPDLPGDQEREAFLRRHQVAYNAFYVGTVGRTVDQIARENQLAHAMQDFLNTKPSWDSGTAALRGAIQKFVFEQQRQRFAWAGTPPPPWVSAWRRFLEGHLSGVAAAVLLLLVAVLAVLGTFLPGLLLGGLAVVLLFSSAYLVVLRFKEERDEQQEPGYSCPAVAEQVEREDRGVQNQMTAFLNIKPGWFRLYTLRTVLAIVNLFARNVAHQGSLVGIPSIHFARWAIIDDGRRLLFLSNFDGSWENYLGDFIDKAAFGLTAIWTNATGFPKTRWLFLAGGARDEQRFKDYARRSQVATQVWYSAYKELTVQNINNNSLLRAGLYGTLDPEESEEWLRRF